MIYKNILYDVVYFILCTTHTYCIMHTVYNTLVLKTPQLQPSEELLIASTQTPTELGTTSNTTCMYTCEHCTKVLAIKAPGQYDYPDRVHVLCGTVINAYVKHGRS